MEMNMGKFSEKLVELLELAKKKKNVLEYQEINDFFKDQPLGVEQMEKVFDFLVGAIVSLKLHALIVVIFVPIVTWCKTVTFFPILHFLLIMIPFNP